ncbi:MAG: hypothetical protein CM1200mP39_12240 [Dehalococcoidia bacterium]|nr:MAG: hypothetical protein CM1200mP39_12240 [Dehalococcoidia bacterium]
MDVIEVIHRRLSWLVASCVKRILSFLGFPERKGADQLAVLLSEKLLRSRLCKPNLRIPH